MSVNKLLCVGRKEMSFGSLSKFHSPRPYAKRDTDDLKLDLHEPRILPIPPSKGFLRDLSPPTRSILRGKSPTPKDGSPLGSRSVRFSEKDGPNGIGTVFAKLHVNETSQTEEGDIPAIGFQSRATTQSKGTSFQPQLTRPKPLPYHTKTSTPRNGSTNGAPEVDFTFPVNDDTSRPDTNQQSYQRRVSQQKSNIPVYQRLSRRDLPQRSNGRQNTEVNAFSSQPKIPCLVPDGKKIVKNIDFGSSPRFFSPLASNEYRQQHSMTQTNTSRKRHRSPSPIAKTMPNGVKILQNWTIEKMRTRSTQTNDDEDSVRSQSPDYQYTDENNTSGISDGDRSLTSTYTSTAENTVIVYEANKSIAIQAFSSDLDAINSVHSECIQVNMNEDDSVRSESTQVNLDEEGTTHSEAIQVNLDGEESVHSEATQVNMDEEEMSHSEATQVNMDEEEMSHSEATQVNMEEEEMSHSEAIQVNLDEEEMVHSEATQVNFNDEEPFRSESIQVNMDEDECARSIGIQASGAPDMSDGSSIVKNMTVLHRPAEKKVIDPEWNEFVRNLDKYSSPESDRRDNASPVAALPVYAESKPVELLSLEPLSEHSARSLLKGDAYKKRQLETIISQQGFHSGVAQSNLPVYQQPMPVRAFHPTAQSCQKSNQSPGHCSGTALGYSPYSTTIAIPCRQQSPEHTKTDQYINQSHSRRRSNSLDFTPIETYSFKPETLKNKETAEVKQDASKRESVTRNAFIQGLDLGPLPISIPKQKSTPSTNLYKSGSYTSPLSRRNPIDYTSYDDTGRSQYRRSSPSIKSSYTASTRSSYLTPSLYQLRSTAARKSYCSSPSTGRYSSLRSSSPATRCGSTPKFSATSRLSRYDSFRDRSKSYEDALLKQWSTSSQSYSHLRTSSARKASTSPSTSLERRFSPQRQVSSETPDYLYTDALKNVSNKRPSSRERSPYQSPIRVDRSRSRSRSPQRTTLSYTEASKGDYVSMETSRRINKRSPSPPVSRKPPLPRNSRSSKSPDREGSFRVISREPSKPMSEYTDMPLGLGNASSTYRNTEQGSMPSSIRIGQAQEGVENKECVYLGNDTIQKIIEKAAL